MSRMKSLVEDTLDRIFPKRRIYLPASLRALLDRDGLRIVDVGGAMGPDERWKVLGLELCRFVTFEPDSRSFKKLAIDSTGRNASLAVGLSDKEGDETLYLTHGQFASSLYRPNAAVLKDYATWPWHESAGETKIPVDTLDHALADHREWWPEFIKVDVEGADLDVLKGATTCLPDVFGVQVEVAFVERNIGAPLQPEIDSWLRAAGFIPHQVIREHWIRNNGIFGATSRPQLIWADVVYFRDRSWSLSKLERASVPDRIVIMTKMMAVLLAYGAHDYALELIEAAVSAGHVTANQRADLIDAVKGSVIAVPGYVVRGSIALLLSLAVGAVLLPFGSTFRAVGRQIVAKQAMPLFFTMYRSASRTGLQNSCISDLP